MPTIVRIGPYRFFFYSNENGEPVHIHIQRERMLAKFWLNPVMLASSVRFSSKELRRLEPLVIENRDPFELHPQALKVTGTDVAIVVDLVDGRTISAPLVWFPRLSTADQNQLDNWELPGDGEGIHWPDVDEDLSVAGLLAGTH